MSLTLISLAVFATVTTTLVAGFVFAFALVTMPGLSELEDGEFIRAFQHMDGIIQKNHPLFMLVWAGSILSLVAATGVALWSYREPVAWLLLLVSLIYIGGVQVPTIAVNVPLNNQLQAVRVHESTPAELSAARRRFERTWNRWNVMRTIVAVSSSTLLMIALVIM